MSTAHQVKINIVACEFKADPHPEYARLRAEQPVCPIKLPDKRTVWLVTRYEDAVKVLTDERFVKNPANALPDKTAKQPWVPRFARPLLRNLLTIDKPEHTRLRALANTAFTPRTVEQMRDRIQTVTSDLLRGLHGRQRFDLMRDFALPIPTTVIAEMLGVPPGDHEKFNRWSNSIVETTANRWGIVRALPAALSLMRYIRALIKDRQDNPRDDLTSELVNAEIDGERLDDDDLLSLIGLLFVAGHETTVNLIGTGVLALLQHPEQLELLRNDPELIKPAVEELLRFSSPVDVGTERYASEDLTVGDVTIPAGSLVGVAIGSANRDGCPFHNPERLNITREPNKHIAFGLGPHYCTGASLARLEGQVAIASLLEAAPKIRLDVEPQKLRWRAGLIMRGLESLPVAVDEWNGSS
ncbi:MAG: cytochrome P450 [Pirellulales bacterium]